MNFEIPQSRGIKLTYLIIHWAGTSRAGYKYLFYLFVFSSDLLFLFQIEYMECAVNLKELYTPTVDRNPRLDSRVSIFIVSRSVRQ